MKRPVLVIPDPKKPYLLYTDASDVGIGATLSQQDAKGNVRLVSCRSRKLSPPERNYPVHEKEMLALVDTLQAWRHYLLGAEVHVFTDNSALRSLQTTTKPSPRQVRWLEKLQQYTLNVTHIPGRTNVAADALSRLPQRETPSTKSSGKRSAKPTSLLSSAIVDPDITSSKPIRDNTRGFDSTISYPTHSYNTVVSRGHTSVRKWTLKQPSTPFGQGTTHTFYFTGPLCAPMVQQPPVPWWDDYIADPDTYAKYFQPGSNILKQIDCYHHGRIWNGDRIVVPEARKMEVIANYHDLPASGHWGINRTSDLLKRRFDFHKIKRLVRYYVRTCDTCQRMKAEKLKPRGFPPIIGDSPRTDGRAFRWIGRTCQSLTADRVVPAAEFDPKADTYDQVLTVTDRATKMVHLIASREH